MLFENTSHQRVSFTFRTLRVGRLSDSEYKSNDGRGRGALKWRKSHGDFRETGQVHEKQKIGDGTPRIVCFKRIDSRS